MSLRIGILQCDEVGEELRPKFGDYPEMFTRELSRVRPRWTYEIYRVFENDFPTTLGCDAYLATGSSFGVNDDEEWIRRLAELVRTFAEKIIPYVGICFGHQMLAHALGGRVTKADVGWGVGVHQIRFSEGRIGEMDLPADSTLLVSHQDQVIETPSGMEVLGGSDFCPVSWIRFGKHMLGIQGHPEFSARYAKALMDQRRELIGEETYQKGVASLTQSLDKQATFELIARFIEQNSPRKN